ncbi:MAG: PASTA domain-containing protein [Spirochaetales bacterium]|nr:PASTA domain-containing protein [Spirochaetales bacterium]
MKKNIFSKKNRDINEKKSKKELTPEGKIYRRFVLGGFVVLFLLVFVAFIAFFATVKPLEDKEVPDLVGLELEDAMVLLQKLHLHGAISLRFTDDNGQKGRVIAQDKRKGSTVKTSSVIGLTVSRGKVDYILDDFKGLNVDEVQSAIVSASYADIVTIKRPLRYIESDLPRGVIIEQSPEEGHPFNQPLELEFFVSAGQTGRYISVPEYRGKDYKEIFAIMKEKSNDFNFKFSFANSSKKEKSVIIQTPEVGKKVLPGETIELTLSSPKKLASDVAYGVFDIIVPDYEVAVPVSIFAETDEGTEYEYISFLSRGGLISIPYIEKVGTIFIVKVNGEVKDRVMVRVE